MLPRGQWAFVDPDEPMVPGRLLGVDDPETGHVTVQWLVEEGGRRILRAAHRAWPDIVVTTDNETDIRGTVVLVGCGVTGRESGWAESVRFAPGEQGFGREGSAWPLEAVGEQAVAPRSVVARRFRGSAALE